MQGQQNDLYKHGGKAGRKDREADKIKAAEAHSAAAGLVAE